MTIKEALKSMCNHCEKLSIRDGFIGCPYRCISNDYCEEFETIKKDLEVLEILKNSLELEEEDDCISFKFKFCCDKESLNDDYEMRTIKEWLEHDKK